MGINGPVVVLDNGGGNIKLGFGGEAAPRKMFPNCTAKPKGERSTLVGDMLPDSKEISQLTLRRPFDRGYLVGWDLERDVWAHAFKAVLGLGKQGGLATRDCGLLLSEPMFNFPAVQAATEQIVFEEFGFNSFHSAPAPVFSLRRMAALHADLPAAQAGAGVVVDAGFSFTHIVPFFEGQPVLQGVKRINVGGKALTNYLKEVVSFRSMNMMDETYLMECVKDELSFVSSDVRHDLKLAATRASPHRREFVLPDGVSNFRGYVKPVAGAAAAAGPGQLSATPAEGAAPQPGPSRPVPSTDQVLMLNNERFMVPEVLFHPSNIGLDQAGVAESVQQALQSVHPALQGLLYTNIILTGGVASCPGFTQRFTSELQPLVPDDYALGVHTPADPALCAWEGMSAFVASGHFRQLAMTKAEYEETGGSRGHLR